jgi:hypothetical protein
MIDELEMLRAWAAVNPANAMVVATQTAYGTVASMRARR